MIQPDDCRGNRSSPCQLSSSTFQPAANRPQFVDASSDSLSGISLDILTGSYLVSVPADPQAPTTQSGTYYTIVQDSNGRITVSAQTYEGSSTITVTR